MQFVLRLFWVLLIVSFIFACTKDNADEPAEENLGDCDTTKVTWCNPVRDLIVSKCAISGCHDSQTATSGIVLEKYSEAKAKADDGRIKARAIDESPSSMPPSNPLSASDKQTIQQWLDGGAPEK
ncbi:hypothetical protein JYT51_01100 [Candidatus Amoebophilus asiaticus]|nr:hypothetical protein [Candidatus Amoebophilus asiaticus]